MSNIIIISSSVKRCTVPLLRATHARGFAREFTGRQVQGASLSTFSRIDNQLNDKSPTMNRGADLANRTPTWNDEMPHMMRSWKDLLSELMDIDCFKLLPEVVPETIKMLNYTVLSGTKRQYLNLIHAYKLLAPADQLTEENIRLARILGCCIELWLSAYFTIDDVVDNAEMRQELSAWHKNVNGTSAVLDGVNLDHFQYELIKRNFRERPYYKEMVDIFAQLSMKVAIGMTAELVTSVSRKKPNLKHFTVDFADRICRSKTVPAMTAPVHLAMYHAGIADPVLFRHAAIVLEEIGRFFQRQNDYLDCFGNPEYKTASDIAAGIISWTIAVALEHATPQQRKRLEECYGHDDPEKVATVKQLYTDIGIHSLFAEYEQQSYDLTSIYIQQLPDGLPHDIFIELRDHVYEKGMQKKFGTYFK